jgi:proteic killer suppression protein
VIRSFADKATEALFETGRHRSFGTASGAALRKLKQLDLVEKLDELRIPPGNRLELLKGNRAGQHSVRVNDQFRVCFRWTEQGPEEVEVVDYH